MHSDLTSENVLWDPAQRRVTAHPRLRVGPPRPGRPRPRRAAPAAWPYLKLHVAADYEHLTKHEDYAEVPWWLSESYPELFSFPRQLDRVRIYAIACGRTGAACLPA